MKADKKSKVQSRRSAAINATAAKLAKVEKQARKFRLPTDPYERTCLVTLQRGGDVDALAKEVAAQFTKDTRKPWRAKPAFFIAWVHDYLAELKSHGITPKITGKFPKEHPTEAELASLKGEARPQRHTKRTSRRRASRLPDGAPMEFAPENEQGVVFLFSHLARKLGLRIESIRTGFPDCLALQDGKEIKIEFEFKSRNFKTHKHQGKDCDWIVCWEHNWPFVPKHMRVVELRREFGLGFNVWFQPVTLDENYGDELTGAKSLHEWSVPSEAMVGDLLLFYRTANGSKPRSCVRDIFRVTSPVVYIPAEWKEGKDYFADSKRVCTLDAPLHLTQLREDSVLCKAGFVRGQMQGRYRATAYWPELYRMIIALNPSLKAKLHKKFPPERVT